MRIMTESMTTPLSCSTITNYPLRGSMDSESPILLRLYAANEESFTIPTASIQNKCQTLGDRRSRAQTGVANQLKDWKHKEEENALMDSALWGELPYDTLEQVLLKLPAKSLAKFRSVSRSWQTMLSCPSFLRTLFSKANLVALMLDTGLGRSKSTSVIGRSEPTTCSGVAVVNGDDLGLPQYLLLNDSIPPRFSRWGTTAVTHVHAQRGLLCWATQEQRHKQQLLCLCMLNPVNGTWRELPELVYPETWQGWRCKAEVFLQVDGDVGACNKSRAAFKVFVASLRCVRLWDGAPPAILSVFSSTSGTWNTVPHPCYKRPRSLFPGLGYAQTHVACGDLVYVMFPQVEELSVVTIPENGQAQVLSKLSVAQILRGLSYEGTGQLALAEYAGTLLAVTSSIGSGPRLNLGGRRNHARAVDINFVEPKFSITIWLLKLQDGGHTQGQRHQHSRWEQLAMMPATVSTIICQDVCLWHTRQVQILGDVVFIHLMINAGILCGRNAFYQTAVVAYHIQQKVWRVILHDKSSDRALECFQPRPKLYL